MKPIIILVRAEGDFERAISIGIEAKKKHKVFFIYFVWNEKRKFEYKLTKLSV